MNPFSNPASHAMGYLNQIPGYLNQYLSPYINAGQNALPILQNQYSQLMNPNFINQFGQGFQQSPGFNFQVNQATNAANRAAAAGGMLGSPEEQQNLAGTVSGLANQDYYNWLSHGLNMYGQGLSGEQNLYNTGFNASNNLSDSLASALMSQANLSYAGQTNQNEMMGGLLGAGLGALGSIGGAFLGGPIGSAIGGGLSHLFGAQNNFGMGNGFGGYGYGALASPSPY